MLKNKKFFIVASLAALVNTALVTTAYSAESKQNTDAVVATVNTDKIMKSELVAQLETLKQQRRQKGDPDEAAALNYLILTSVALQEARKSGFLDRESSKNAIRDYTNNYLLSGWTAEKMQAITVDHTEIKNAYDQYVSNFETKEFNARFILVNTEAQANEVIEQVHVKNANFEAIAKEKSIEVTGGDAAWFTGDRMGPVFFNALKSMAEGDISKEPIKTEFGYNIIKLEGSREIEIPSLESVELELDNTIAQEKMLAYLESLKAAAEVKILNQ